MANPQLEQYWAELERTRGLPAGYLARTRQIESGGGKNLYSRTGPVGPFQFTRKTALAMGLPLNQRLDEFASARAAADYAAQNKSILSKALGRDPSGGELYLGHQQGGPGAASILRNPNARAGSVTLASNISNNAGDPRALSSKFSNKFIDRYNNALPSTALQTTVAQAAPTNTPLYKPGEKFDPAKEAEYLRRYNAGEIPPISTAMNAPAGVAPVAPAATVAAVEPPKALPAIREGGGLLGMARRWQEGAPSATALMPRTPITDAVLASAAQAPPKPVGELSNFMGSPEMSASLKGAGMLAAALNPAPPPAPTFQLQVEDAHYPDLSLLLKRKRGLA